MIVAQGQEILSPTIAALAETKPGERRVRLFLQPEFMMAFDILGGVLTVC